MKKFLTTAALTLALASPAAAQSFKAENRVLVTPVADGFAIRDGGGHGARGMWCAAADYARKMLRAPGSARIYIKAPRSDRFAPVVFTLDPTGLNPQPVVIVGASLRRAGSNLSVDHAYSFCADARMINR